MRWPRRAAAAAVAAVALTVAATVPAAAPAPAVASPGAAPPAQATTVRDHRGVELRLERPPRRIVTLLPSLTESVCALDACDRLVGVDRYSDWPAAVAALPRLGGLDDAQVERIVALAPDLVLAARSTRAVDRLQALGLPVLAFDSDTHEQLRSTLLALGRALGRPARAEALLAGIEAELEQARALVPPAWRGQRVYFEADATPYAAGESSFIGQTLSRLGLANIAPASMGPFPKLNPEHVVRSQPALVIAARRNAQDMPGRPGWRALAALQSGRVCAFGPGDYEQLIRPGPRLGEAARSIARCVAALPAPGAAGP